MKKLILGIIITASSYISAAPYSEALHKILVRYKRPITVLEIGSAEHVAELVQRNSVTAVTLIPGDSLIEIPSSLLTVLAPQQLTIGQLQKLAQCEHIDVVLVRDLTSVIQVPIATLVGTLINLGEHVFIEATNRFLKKALVNSTACAQVTESLFYSYRAKNSLAYTRFTAKNPSFVHYEVQSSYQDKQLIKEEGRKGVPWVPGINLVTFIMLNGVCPTDEHIKKQLRSFEKRYPHHNDLVIGNIIVQGTTLIPIDFSDARRNASLKECITAAIQAFDTPGRHEDPQKWFYGYTKRLLRNRR